MRSLSLILLCLLVAAPAHAQDATPDDSAEDRPVRFLSPEPDEAILAEDVAVAVSLYYVADTVNRSATRLKLDGQDLSEAATRVDDLLLYRPQDLSAGPHELEVELYDAGGNLLHTATSRFTVTAAAAVPPPPPPRRVQPAVRLTGAASSSLRNEQLRGSEETYLRGNYRVDGTYGTWRFGLRAHLNNQETSSIQPQNRYQAYVAHRNFRIDLGDSYPQFPSLIVSDQRVRGVNARIRAGFFNLDATYGQIDRSIEGISLRDTTFISASSAATRPFNTVPGGGLTYTIFSPGTYARNLTVVRPSFGRRESFQFGLTYMKASDQVSSIDLGGRPKENLLVGSDLYVAFLNRRLRWETQAAMSITNNNIAGGDFTPAFFDSLRQEDPDAADLLESVSDIGSRFITMNEFLFPFNPVGKGLPGLSAESVIALDALQQHARLVYFRRGAAYTSFANRFLETDLQGFLISDRIRLLRNRFVTTLSYERKQNNTANTHPSTTVFNTLRSSFMINPGVGWPLFNVGFERYGRENDNLVFSPDSTLSSPSISNTSNRFFGAVSYSFTGAGLRHIVRTNMSLLDRTDDTIYARDQQNVNVQASWTLALLSIPLKATAGYQISSNEILFRQFQVAQGTSAVITNAFDYSVYSISADYTLHDLHLLTSLSMSTGDVDRETLRFGADYTFLNRHTVEARVDYFRNALYSNDVITSLVYRTTFQ